MDHTSATDRRVESAELTPIFDKIKWRLVPFLCACYITAYVDRINVGFAKLQMLSALGFSEAAYGLGAGIFFVGYVLFEVPSNIVLERVGARVWIARIMVTWGIICILGAWVRTPTQFYAMRFMLGAAEAGFLPGALYYLSRWFPSYRRSRIFALLIIGVPLAGMIGGPLSGWVMRQFAGVADMGGWQWLFIITGTPPLMFGLLVLALLPERPADARWLSPAERSALQAALDADLAETPNVRHRLRDGLLNLRIWVLGFIDLTILTGVYAVSFWLPTFIRAAGVTDTFHIGLLSAIPGVSALASMLLSGFSSDKFRERRWHIIVPLLIAATAMAATTLAEHNLAMTVALFALSVAGLQGAIPPFYSVPAALLRGPAAAAGFALVISIASISGLISNAVMGFALELTGSSHAAILIFASFLIIGAGFAFSLPRSVNR